MQTVFAFDNSINYLKEKFLNNYCNFVKDFINYKTSSGENFYSYVRIDDCAVFDLSTIYHLEEYLDWAKTNNFIVKEFDASKYLINIAI